MILHYWLAEPSVQIFYSSILSFLKTQKSCLFGSFLFKYLSKSWIKLIIKHTYLLKKWNLKKKNKKKLDTVLIKRKIGANDLSRWSYSWVTIKKNTENFKTSSFIKLYNWIRPHFLPFSSTTKKHHSITRITIHPPLSPSASSNSRTITSNIPSSWQFYEFSVGK